MCPIGLDKSNYIMHPSIMYYVYIVEIYSNSEWGHYSQKNLYL